MCPGISLHDAPKRRTAGRCYSGYIANAHDSSMIAFGPCKSLWSDRRSECTDKVDPMTSGFDRSKCGACGVLVIPNYSGSERGLRGVVSWNSGRVISRWCGGCYLMTCRRPKGMNWRKWAGTYSRTVPDGVELSGSALLRDSVVSRICRSKERGPSIVTCYHSISNISSTPRQVNQV